MNNIWEDLNRYYQLYGTGYLCCCKIDQYSRIFYSYSKHKNNHINEPYIQHIIDFTYSYMKSKGHHNIQFNDCQIICSTTYLTELDYLLKTHALCIYDLEKQEIDVHPIHTENNHPKIYIYLWK